MLTPEKHFIGTIAMPVFHSENGEPRKRKNAERMILYSDKSLTKLLVFITLFIAMHKSCRLQTT
jgi:hypothetical protein